MDRDFERGLQEDNTVSAIENKIVKGKADFGDVNKLASAAGKVASGVIGERLQEAYPNGKVDENDVRVIFSPIMKDCFSYVSGMTAAVIDQMYEDAGVGLKATIPAYDQEHEDEIIAEISSRSFENGFAW